MSCRQYHIERTLVKTGINAWGQLTITRIKEFPRPITRVIRIGFWPLEGDFGIQIYYTNAFGCLKSTGSGRKPVLPTHDVRSDLNPLCHLWDKLTHVDEI